MTLAIIGGLSLAIWLYLVFAHHGFWRADQRLPAASGGVNPWPEIVAIVPARDEAPTIAACMDGLAHQNYAGRLSIILVDDGSTDETAGLAQRALASHAVSACVVSAPPLRPGWTGKLWALRTGLEEAELFAPNATHVWFTDADIVHEPGTLSELATKAAEGRDLVSLMVRLHCGTPWERLLIPAFVFFFQMLYPFPAVNDRPSRVGGAAGGCMLVRRGALTEAGGISAISGALIDDCALAELLRRKGFALWLGLARTSHSLRVYQSLSDVWAMVARTAYTQLGHSPVLLLGTLAGLLLTFIAPPLLALLLPFHSNFAAAGLGAAAWLLMAMAYWPTRREYGGGVPGALTLPVAAALYCAMTLDSALRHWRGKGGQWKARAYDFG